MMMMMMMVVAGRGGGEVERWCCCVLGLRLVPSTACVGGEASLPSFALSA